MNQKKKPVEKGNIANAVYRSEIDQQVNLSQF